MPESIAIFCLVGPFYGVLQHLKVYLMQHDILLFI